MSAVQMPADIIERRFNEMIPALAALVQSQGQDESAFDVAARKVSAYMGSRYQADKVSGLVQRSRKRKRGRFREFFEGDLSFSEERAKVMALRYIAIQSATAFVLSSGEINAQFRQMVTNLLRYQSRRNLFRSQWTDSGDWIGRRRGQ